MEYVEAQRMERINSKYIHIYIYITDTDRHWNLLCSCKMTPIPVIPAATEIYDNLVNLKRWMFAS